MKNLISHKNKIYLFKFLVVFFLVGTIIIILSVYFFSNIRFAKSNTLLIGDFTSRNSANYLLKLNKNNDNSSLFITKNKFRMEIYKKFYGIVELNFKNATNVSTVVTWNITKNNPIETQFIKYFGAIDPTNYSGKSGYHSETDDVYLNFGRAEDSSNTEFFIYAYKIDFTDGYKSINLVDLNDSSINLYLY